MNWSERDGGRNCGIINAYIRRNYFPQAFDKEENLVRCYGSIHVLFCMPGSSDKEKGISRSQLLASLRGMLEILQF